tara:strand:+ start:140 stop:334 length:195 start_codon:yes stop_codon:yes gene_type:complete
MSINETKYTMQEAAEMLEVSHSRIRQLCIEYDLGEKLGQYRLLNDEDITFLKAIPRKIGRPKSA